MPSQDEIVLQQDVLDLIQRVRAAGWRAEFEDLADHEPVLAGYALCASDLLGARLTRMGVPSGIQRLIETEMMTAQLVCIRAMRNASRQLWHDFLPGQDVPKQP